MQELIKAIEQWAHDTGFRLKAPLYPQYNALKTLTNDIKLMKLQRSDSCLIKQQAGDIVVLSIISKILLSDKLKIGNKYIECLGDTSITFNKSHLKSIDKFANIATDVAKLTNTKELILVADASFNHIKQQDYYNQFKG